MRVLVIWGESLAKPGGGTVHCLGLCGGLVAGGHRVTIITPRYGRQELDCGGLDVRPVALPRRSILSFLCFQAISVLLLPLWLIRYRPSVVYVRTCFLQGIMALICRAAGVPLVGEVDSMVDQEILMRGEPAWAASLARGLDRVNNRLTSALVCVSRGLRIEQIRRGAHPDSTITVHNGARTDLMRPVDRLAARDRFGLPKEAFIVGFAGSFAPWQGLDFLLDAAGRIPGSLRPRLKLALMGGGIAADDLRRGIEDRGLKDMFILLDEGPPQRVAGFLDACDAGVIPIHDPRKLGYCSPLKFWDAISVGLPVLVARGSEIDEVLRDLSLPGTFDPADPQSLAEALMDLVENADQLRSRRLEVHELVKERYDWRRVAERTVELFDHLRRGRRPPK